MKTKTEKELIEKLKKHYHESREYLNDFYKQCQNYEVDDCDWIECDKDFDNFLASCPVEYNRIYDMAIKNLTGDLLINLGVRINN